MWFRALSVTIHLAQLLQDLVLFQQRWGQELWLVSFDLEKCFQSLPWWGLFGVLARVGLMRRLFSVFAAFIGSSGVAADINKWMAPSGLWPAVWHRAVLT